MARFMVIKVAISRKNIEIWRVLWGGDKKRSAIALLRGGQRWIRTTEGVSQQIYSLPHLATLVFAHAAGVLLNAPTFTLQSYGLFL